MGWSWNLGPSVSILLRVDEPRHPRVINCAKGPPPWSKEKEEKEMREMLCTKMQISQEKLVVVSCRSASITPNRGGFFVGSWTIHSGDLPRLPSIHRPRLVTL